MKILLCSETDYGGGMWFLASAINRYTNHEARHFRMRQCYLDYPYHMLAPRPDKMQALVEWCDVLHVRESEAFLPSDCLQKKPTVVTYCGRGFRKAAKQLIETRRARGWLVTVSTPDLPFYYPDAPPLWLPNAREDMVDYPGRKYQRFTVAHAPTFRERKGTATLIKAIQALHDVDLELIEQSTYSQCLQRKAWCHLLFDQFANGYGNNAIEAWALGMPVVSNDLATQFTHHLEEACGYLPFVKVPEDVHALREVIDHLRRDKAFYAEMLDKGRRFFFTYHHAPAVAERAIEIYGMALDKSHKSAYSIPLYPQAPKKGAPAVIKNRELNILSLGTWDYAGCGYFLSKAINQTTSHHSRAVCWHTSELQFPHDIYRPSLAELTALWKWADVVHIHDNIGMKDNRISPSSELQAIVTLPPKPTVITHHGTLYRKHIQYFNGLARDYGWLQTCSTLDLTLFGPYWLPDCRFDLSEYVNRPEGHFIVAHAPTHRWIKGTDIVIKAMKGLSDFQLIENLVWSECIKRKGQASVLIDQFKLGYGCNAIEAWAMSQAVVASAPSDVLKLFEEHIGYIPFVNCPCEAGAIRATAKQLKDDLAYYQQAVERGHQCWRDFHSPEATAQQALAYYDQAMLRGPARLGHTQDTASSRLRSLPTIRPLPTKEPIKEPISENLVQIEYIGPNKLDMVWFGDATNKRYKFGGVHRRGYVYQKDVSGLLASVDKQGGPVFRVVK